MSKGQATNYVDVASWELSDSLWLQIEPLLPKVKSRYRGRGKQRKHIGGRPAADRRKLISGILFVLRTGCQWNRVPRIFGDDSTVHRWFQRFVEDGVLEELWAVLLSECEELGALDWRWQAADGSMGKARLGGAKRGPIPLTEPSPVRSAA